MTNIARLGGAVLVILLLGVLTAGGAAAKTPTLELAYENSSHELVGLSSGEEIEAFDPSWTLETAAGNVNCTSEESTTGFLGSAETNNEKTDKLSATHTFHQFFAEAGCPSTLALVGSSVEGFWFNANTFGEEVKGLFTLGTKGKGEYATTGSKDTAIEIREAGATGPRCYYEVTKLKGTTPVFSTTFASAANITFSKQKVKLLKLSDSSALCPKKATVSTEVGLYAPLGGSESIVFGLLK